MKKLYKGVEYFCEVDGEGRLIMNGVTYNSPSMAAIHIVKHASDGWHFWRYQDKDGNWVRIDSLRK